MTHLLFYSFYFISNSLIFLYFQVSQNTSFGTKSGKFSNLKINFFKNISTRSSWFLFELLCLRSSIKSKAVLEYFHATTC